MSNEHIEYFKRFSSAHLRWINFEFDRIVTDAVKRQELIKIEQDKLKEKIKFDASPYGKFLNLMREQRNQYLDEVYKENLFISNIDTNNMKIGSTLRIRLPADYKS